MTQYTGNCGTFYPETKQLSCCSSLTIKENINCCCLWFLWIDEIQRIMIDIKHGLCRYLSWSTGNNRIFNFKFDLFLSIILGCSRRFFGRMHFKFPLPPKNPQVKLFNKSSIHFKSLNPCVLSLSGMCFNIIFQVFDSFTKAVKANPNFAEAFYHRGLCKVKLNKDNSILDFNRAITLNPKHYQVFK